MDTEDERRALRLWLCKIQQRLAELDAQEHAQDFMAHALNNPLFRRWRERRYVADDADDAAVRRMTGRKR